MSEDAENIPALYTRHADAFAELRGKALFEKPWLDRFTEGLPQGATILDLGCGSGEPLAAALIADGFRLTGIDVSPRLIELCRQRFPEHDWQVGDMRALPPLGRYAGILAWHSFFHLDFEAQRRMFPVFSILAAPGASLMFTSGPSHGVAMGTFEGEPLHHASLAPEEYRALLAENDFSVVRHQVEDPDCGGATIWLACKAH